MSNNLLHDIERMNKSIQELQAENMTLRADNLSLSGLVSSYDKTAAELRAENEKMQVAFIHVENICMYVEEFDGNYQAIWNFIRDARGLPR